ncbi:MAG: hypothetical protein GXP43_03045 [bacterium]|nr:hypothetical protein [bacterium]
MQDLGLAFDLVMLTVLALVGGVIAKRLKQPLILGYLAMGLLFSFLPVKFFDWHSLEVIADIGVAFLMFTLGLEFSFDRFRKVKNVVLWGGIVQITAVLAVMLMILPFLGFSFGDGFYIAAAFSLSSTAVVIKILSDRGELLSLPGQIMVGWLLLQDLAVLPMMILIPSFAKAESAGWSQVIPSLGRSIVVLYVVLVLAKKIVPKLTDWIASFNSREVLLLFVVSLSLAAAFFTYSLGMSFAIGAFIAGLLISTTVESHAVFAEIRPLRDLFITIFFLTLAINSNPTSWLGYLGLIGGLTVLVMLFKMLLIFGLTVYFGYHSKVAFLVGVGLVQVGEFGFILAQEGLRSGLISNYSYSIIVAVTLMTILLTPVLFNGAASFYDWVAGIMKRRLPKVAFYLFPDYRWEKFGRELPFKNHVVICGYGRMGRYIGRALQLNNIDFVVIDYNKEVIKRLEAASIPVVYGDPSSREILDYAQVDYARAVVIAIPDFYTQSQVIVNSRSLNPKVKILCRTHREIDQPKLRALGADVIIQPEFEAGVYAVRKLADLFGFRGNVDKNIHRLRIEHGIVRSQ